MFFQNYLRSKRASETRNTRIQVQLIRILYISNSRKGIIYKILTVLDSRYFVYYVGKEKFFHKLQFWLNTIQNISKENTCPQTTISFSKKEFALNSSIVNHTRQLSSNVLVGKSRKRYSRWFIQTNGTWSAALLYINEWMSKSWIEVYVSSKK